MDGAVLAEVKIGQGRSYDVPVFVQRFLYDGKGAAGLCLDGFEYFRLDVFLKKCRDMRVEL